MNTVFEQFVSLSAYLGTGAAAGAILFFCSAASDVFAVSPKTRVFLEFSGACSAGAIFIAVLMTVNGGVFRMEYPLITAASAIAVSALCGKIFAPVKIKLSPGARRAKGRFINSKPVKKLLK